MNNEVKQYLTRFEQTELADLLLLRGRIMNMLQPCEEGFEYGFPVYYFQGKATAGYAKRQEGLMFFLMEPDIVERYKEKLSDSLEGKVSICVKRPNTKLDHKLLEVIDDMLWEVS